MRQATPEEFARIMQLLHAIKVNAGMKSIAWGGPEVIVQARLVIRELGGKWSKRWCWSCQMNNLNLLYRAAGLPPVFHEVPAAQHDKRMAICLSCNAYHATTRSCGELGNFLQDPIEIDGALVQPCACFLPLKTRFKHSQCPAGKW